MRRPQFCIAPGVIVVSLALAIACGGGDPVDPGERDASPAADAALDAGDRQDAAAGNGECTEYEVVQLCVRGDPDDGEELLREGEPVTVQIRPEGCHSSSCTVADEASCEAALEGQTIDVTGGFCLRDISSDEVGCTPDCGGGGSADCQSESGLAAGDYTATFGDLSVDFSVPGALPSGGACDHLAEES